MGQRFAELSDRHIEFIGRQRIFFVGTATADSRVNVSPKGMDSLRVYGRAKVVHRSDAEWHTLVPLFKPLPGARQIFDMTVELVQTSCGMGVPCYDYAGDRELLNDWARNKGEDGVKRYWEEKNTVSIDGIPSDIVARNG